MRLQGKVALVTGGAGRIGRATVKRFAQEGAKVAIGDLNGEAAERLAAEIGENGLAIAFDAHDPASIEAMVNRAAEHFGRLDILHNNAALLDIAWVQQDGTVLDTPLEVWDRTMEVNVRGYMLACRHAIPHMRAAGGGSIINTSSTEAEVGNLARIAYACSKGAVSTLTRYIATQHGREGIRCNTILPGLILDPTLEARVGEFADVVKRHLLIGRNGRPEDIAATAAFLASDDSAFITGQAINVDGGLLVHMPQTGEMMEQGDMLRAMWRGSPSPGPTA